MTVVVDWLLSLVPLAQIVIGGFLAYAAVAGVSTWKQELRTRKRFDSAEEALLIVYEVVEAIRQIRWPGETFEERARVDAARHADASPRASPGPGAIAFVRMDQYQELFKQMRALRPRLRLHFGSQLADLIGELDKTIGDLMKAAAMNEVYARAREDGPLSEDSRKREAEGRTIIWRDYADPDHFGQRVEGIRRAFEHAFDLALK